MHKLSTPLYIIFSVEWKFESEFNVLNLKFTISTLTYEVSGKFSNS